MRFLPGCLHAAGSDRTPCKFQEDKTDITREDEALLVQQWDGVPIRLHVRVYHTVVDDYTIMHRLISGQVTGILEGNGVSGGDCFPDARTVHPQRITLVPSARTVRLGLFFYR